MPQSIHQRQAVQAVIRRRMRGIPSAPTRNGASAPATPPVAEQEGAGFSSFSPAPSDPLSHPAVQIASLVVGWCIMGLIMWACLMGLIG
jgi:hypothetical protein